MLQTAEDGAASTVADLAARVDEVALGVKTAPEVEPPEVEARLRLPMLELIFA